MGYGCTLPSARPQLPISHRHQPRQPPARVGGIPWLSLTWKPLALLVLLAVAVSPLQAQDPDPAAGLPVCDRTEQVRDAIVAAVDGVGSCAYITEVHLAGITQLSLADESIRALRVGDLSGLAALEILYLDNNLLTELPSDIFTGLAALQILSLNNNNLEALPSGVFTNLAELNFLLLDANSLTALPAGLFSGLRALTYILLQNNPGSEDFLPIANAGADRVVGAGQIATLTATASDTDPWGDNVSYAWAQIDNGGDLVTLKDGKTARPSFVMPAGATALEFELTVTGRGGVLYSDTDRVTVRYPGAAVPVCGRTEQVRDAIVAAVDGVGNCADITEAHLAKIAALSLAGTDIRTLKTGDFASLSALESLYLNNSPLTELPSDIFTGLAALRLLNLNNNNLAALPAGAFADLTALEHLSLSRNNLAALPAGALAGLTALISLHLHGNPGGEAFLPIASAGADQVVETGQIATLTATASDADPWGDNVLYAWARIDNGGDLVTLKDADTARPSFVMPAGATALEFELTVTGRGGAGYADTDSVTVLNPSAVVPVCGRTEQVRDAIVAAVSGVNGCADITEGHLAGIIQLLLVDKGIGALQAGDFAGLAELETLELRGNSLTTLPAGAFTGLTALQYLYLDGNSLAALPEGVFNGLILLKTLYLDSNGLMELPPGAFTGLAALKVLGLRDNSLTALPAGAFDGLTGLETLYMSSNGLTALPAGVFADLTALEELYLNSNNLTALPAGAFAGLAELETLELRGNSLTALPAGAFYGLTALQYLYLDGNSLAALPEGVFNGLILLETLYLDSNGLMELPPDAFTGLAALKVLGLRDNSLTALPAGAFDGLTGLETLYLSSNNLAELPSDAFTGLASLLNLRLDGNNLAALPAGIFSGTRALADLRLHGNPGSRGFLPIANAGADQTVEAGQIATLAATASDTDPWGDNVRYAWAQIDNSGNAVVLMDADTARPSFVMPAGATALEFELTVTGLGGAGYADTDSVTVRYPSAVVPVCDRTEQVRDAIVAAVDGVSNCVDITEADLAGITQLFLGDESIRALQVGDFSGLAALNSLVLDNNSLTELPPKIFGGLADLRALFLRDNGLAALPLGVFGGLTDLESLYLNANSLTALATGVFTGLTELKTLELSGNSLMVLTASVFAGLRELSALHLNDNSLTTLPAGTFASLIALQFLHLNDNSLAALPAGTFAGLTALQSLFLNNNGLTALSAGAFAGLTKLRVLFLNDNNLAELPSDAFTSLASLLNLRLDGNNLTALPAGIFSGTRALVYLRLHGNPGSRGFLPIASAGADQAVEAGQIATLTATVSDTDPWGDNVSYAWAQIDNSGNAVVLMDADTARPSFVMPAGATALEFELTVTGLGGAGYADTDSVTVRYPSAVVPVCDRTEQVRDAIVAAVDGVSNCVDITEADLAGITQLFLGDESIRALQVGDFSGLAALNSLILDNNSLTELPPKIFGGLADLRALFLRDNGLAALPLGVFGGLTDLESLYLNANSLTALATGVFTGLTELKTLELSGNSLMALTASVFAGLRELSALHLNDNSLTTLPAGTFASLTALQLLHLNDNSLAALPAGTFAGLTALQSLFLNNNGLTALSAGAFAGLTKLRVLFLNDNNLAELPSDAFTGLLWLRSLNLRDNDLAELPASIFDGLAALRTLQLNNNNLAALPAGVFDDPYRLQFLHLESNRLTALPAGIFSGTRKLVGLHLHGNPGSRGFLPIASAGADQAVEAGQIATLTATVSDTDPWGDNVSYAWAQIDNSGNAVVLMDADTARPSFVMPAGATALEFELTVTGLGGAGYADTDSVTVRYPSAVVPVCDRTEQVRDAIVAAVDGVSNCVDITEADLAGITQLFLGDESIRALQVGDFSGLAALNSLILDNNSLTELPPKIFGGLADLRALFLRDNGLAALPLGVFGGLTDLESLYLNANSLTALATGVFTGLTELKTLELSGNSLMALTASVFAGLRELSALHLNDNSLTTLPAGTFASLTALQLLHLNDNSLAALPAGTFAGLTALQSLFLNNNGLTALSAGAFAGLTKLRVLFLNDNNLAELPSDAFTGLLWLRSLNLRDNDLAELPASIFDGLAALRTLQLNNNNLAALPAGVFDDPYRLQFLHLESNRLTALPAGIFSGTRKLVGLHLHGNPGSRGFLPIASAGADQAVEAGQIATLTATVSDTDPWGDNVSYAWAQIDNSGNAVVLMDADTARPSFVMPAGATALEFELTVTGLGGAGYADTDSVTVRYPSAVVPVCDRTEQVRDAIVAAVDGVSNCVDITEADLAGITQLFLGDESIRALQVGDFSGLAALNSLILDNNSLTELPPKIFGGLADLRALFLRDNGLAALPLGVFGGLTDLESLYLNANSLTALATGVFTGLTELKTLELSGNSLMALTASVFAGLRELSALHLNDNSLTTLPAGTFASLTALQLLHLNDNSLAALPAGTFAGLTALQSLFLNNNGLTALSAGAFAGLTKLRVLFLNDNNLAELPSDAFTGLLWLRSLNLRDNDLAELPASIFDGLAALRTLQLNNNNLAALPAGVFDDPYRLQFLHLESNRLTALPAGIFSGTRKLVGLHLHGNPGSRGFLPIASAGADQAVEAGQIATLTATVSDTDPWGDNVSYAWAQIDNSGNAVVLMDADTARPSFVMPAGATALEFELTVTGLGGAGYADTDSVTVRYPSAVVPVCDRTEQVRDAIVAAVDGVSNCVDITEADLAGITQLFLGDESIRALQVGDFSGLAALNSLILDNNSLTELPPKIFGGLADLRALFLRDNGLAALPLGVFGGLTDLESLYLNANSLTALATGVFTGLTELKTLELSGNSLMALTASVFAGLRELSALHLNDNSLTTLPAGTFASLTALQLLHLNDNSLAALPAGTFAGLTALQSLFLNNNGLTALSAGAFAGLTKLRVLFLNDNNLAELPSDAFTGLLWLRSLNLRDNDLAELPASIFDGLAALRTLQLNNNNLAALPAGVFDDPYRLQFLHLESNRLTALPAGIFSGTRKLVGLHLHGNPGSRGFLPIASAGADQAVEAGQIATLTATVSDTDPWGDNVSYAWAQIDNSGNAVVLMDADTARPSFVMPAGATALEFELTVTGLGGAGYADTDSVTVRYPSAVVPVCDRTEQVRDAIVAAVDGVSNCVDITEADLAGITQLFLGDESIRALQVGDFSGLAALNSLILDNNSLTELPPKIFGGLADLRALFLRDNGLAALPLGVFGGLTDLESLYLNANSLTALATGVFTGLTELKTLELSGNSLMALTASVFAGLRELSALHLNDNSLTTLPAGTFASLTALQLLHLNDNSLAALPAGTFAGLTALQSLFLNNNGLTALSAGAFAGLTKLRVLFLNDNNLAELPSDAFTGLLWLRSLNLRDNDLAELPASIFDGLAALRTLQLNNNNLAALPTGVFDDPYRLQFLHLESNRLTALPAGIFSGTRKLVGLHLHGNPGSRGFLPIASAGADQAVEAGQIATLTATVSDTDPWGDNVSYAWAQIDNSGNAVVLMDADTARPSFVMPAGATALEFELTVTGLGGAGYADTDSVTVRLPATVVTLAGPVHDLLQAGATAIVGDGLRLIYSYSADDLRGRVLAGSIEVAASIDGAAITYDIRIDGVRGEITVVLRRQAYPDPGEHELTVTLSAAAEGFVLGETSSITTPFSFLPLPPTVLEVRQAEGNQGKRGAAGSDIIELGYIFEYAADNRLNRPRAGLSVQIDIELCADVGSGCAILPGASQALILDGNGSLTLRVDRTLAALSIFGEADADSIRHGRVLLRTAGDADFAAAAAATTFSFAIAAAVVTLSGPVHDLLPEDATAIAGDVLSLVYSYSADELRGRVLTGSIEVAAAIDGEVITPEIRVAGVRGEITVVLWRQAYPDPGEHELAVTLSAAAEGFVLAEPSLIETTFSFLPLPPTVLEVRQAEGNQGKRGAAGNDIIELGYIFEYAADNRLDRPRAGLSVQVDIELCADAGGGCVSLPMASQALMLDGNGSLTLRVDRTAAALSVFGEADDDSIRHGRVLLSTAGDGDFAAAAATTTFSFAVAAAVVTLSGPVHDLLPADATAIAGDVLSLVYSYSADELRGRVLTGGIEAAATINGLAITPAIKVNEDEGRGRITVVLRREKYPDPGEHELAVALSLSAAAEGFVLGEPSSMTTPFSFSPLPPTVLEVRQADGNQGKRGAAGSDAIELGYIFEYAADNRLNRPRAGLVVQVDVELCAAAGSGCAILPGASQALMLDGNGSLTLRVDRTAAALSVFGEADDDSIRHGRVLLRTAGDADFAAAAATTTFSFAVAAAVVTLSGPVHDLLPADATAIAGDVLSLVYSYSADDLRGRTLMGNIDVAAAVDGVAITPAVNYVDGARGEITIILSRAEYPEPGEHLLAVSLSLSATAEGFVLAEPSSIATPFSFEALVVPDTVVTLSGPGLVATTDIVEGELSLVYSYSADDLHGRVLTGSIEVAASIDGVAITTSIEVDEPLGRGEITVVLLRREYPEPGEHQLAVTLSLSATAEGFVLAEPSSIATPFSFGALVVADADTVVTLSGPVPAATTDIAESAINLVYTYIANDLRGRTLSGNIDVVAAVDGVAITPSINVDEAQGRGEITVVLRRWEYLEPGEHELAVTLSLSAAATGFVLGETSSISTTFGFSPISTAIAEDGTCQLGMLEPGEKCLYRGSSYYLRVLEAALGAQVFFFELNGVGEPLNLEDSINPHDSSDFNVYNLEAIREGRGYRIIRVYSAPAYPGGELSGSMDGATILLTVLFFFASLALGLAGGPRRRLWR